MSTPMEPIPVERCRPFSLADAMIFVAASAVGLWLAKGFMMSAWGILHVLWVATGSHGSLIGSLAFSLLNVCVSMLLALTVAFVAVRLRGPRPPFYRVVLQPGMVACQAQIVAFGLAAFLVILEKSTSHWFFLGVLIPAVPLAWGALAWNGRWRREPGWIDRLGLGLGVGWCLEIVSYFALFMATPD